MIQASTALTTAFVLLLLTAFGTYADSPAQTAAPLRGISGRAPAASDSTATPASTPANTPLAGRAASYYSSASPPSTGVAPAPTIDTPVPYPTESTKSPIASPPVDALPTAPASYSPVTSSSVFPVQPSPVKGSAKFTVSASAKVLALPPLMRCRDENLQFVEIDLKNETDQVALVHGDIAEARIGKNLRTAASARYIGTVASPKLNFKGRFLTGWVEAGTLGLAGPIFYENMTPQQHRKRYLGTAIGTDGSRHEVEAQRFGLRVLMPGEETVGWLAFECPDPKELTNLLIPVNYSQSALPSGSLIVPVQHPAAGAPPTNTSNEIEVAPLANSQFKPGGSLEPSGRLMLPDSLNAPGKPLTNPSSAGLNAPAQPGLAAPVLTPPTEPSSSPPTLRSP